MSWDLLVIVPIGLLGVLYAGLTIAEVCLTMVTKWQPAPASVRGNVTSQDTDRRETGRFRSRHRFAVPMKVG